MSWYYLHWIIFHFWQFSCAHNTVLIAIQTPFHIPNLETEAHSYPSPLHSL